jgi:hypothetical protein
MKKFIDSEMSNLGKERPNIAALFLMASMDKYGAVKAACAPYTEY